MSEIVFGLILGSVDVRANLGGVSVLMASLFLLDVKTYHALEVTPADDNADCHTSLVGTFYVVRTPCDAVTDETIVRLGQR